MGCRWRGASQGDGAHRFVDDLSELFGRTIGLDYAIVGTSLPGFLNQAAHISIREDDDRKIAGGWLGPKFFQDFDTAEPGQHQVEDDYVRFGLQRGGETRFAVPCQFHLEAFRLKLAKVDATNDLIVFDDQ